MKILVLLLAASFMLTSCAGGDVSASDISGTQSSTGLVKVSQPEPPVEAPKEASEPETEPEPVNADGYVFVYEGNDVYMDEDMAAVLDRLGEPKSTFEAPSCAFNGIDKIFTYSGMNIHTYPADGADFVHTIHYMDDSITTPEGIRLGASLADVVAAYGENYTEEMGAYTYVKNETYLRFLIKDDMVIDIVYGLTEYMEQI